MGSRYIFVALDCCLEKYFCRGDFRAKANGYDGFLYKRQEPAVRQLLAALDGVWVHRLLQGPIRQNHFVQGVILVGDIVKANRHQPCPIGF